MAARAGHPCRSRHAHIAAAGVVSLPVPTIYGGSGIHRWVPGLRSCDHVPRKAQRITTTQPQPIPMWLPHIGPEVSKAASGALEVGYLGLGSATEEFEEALADYLELDAGRALMSTNSCTAALNCACLAGRAAGRDLPGRRAARPAGDRGRRPRHRHPPPRAHRRGHRRPGLLQLRPGQGHDHPAAATTSASPASPRSSSPPPTTPTSGCSST
jgi:hypothetical protein